MINYLINLIAQLPFIIIITLSTIGVLIGDYFAKIYSEKHLVMHFWLCLLGYIICGIFFIASLLKKDLIYATIFLEIFYLIGILILGFFLFNERFSTIQYVGMFFAITGIIILIFND